MNLNLNILRLASSLASHSSARQQVIAENIAHSDTPGYRAREISDFTETLERTPSNFSARTTRAGHLEFGTEPDGYRTHEETAFGAEAPNGNNVSLEDQMVRSVEVQQNHQLALGVYEKSLAILRTSIGRGR